VWLRPELELFGNKIINRSITEVKKKLTKKGLLNLLKKNLIPSKIILTKKTDYFQTEFDEVVKFEMVQS
jgi:hypothetical protein